MIEVAAAASSTAVTIGAVLFASITAPVMLNYLNERRHAREKEQDWARQDARELEDRKRADAKEKAERERQEEVARKAEVSAVAAQAVAKQAAEAAELLRLQQVEVNAKAAEAASLLAETQAKVAAQAAEAASLLASKQDEIAAQAAEAAVLLLGSNKVMAETAEVTNGKLDVIHGLVNSSLTGAMEDQLEARRNELVLMKEVSRLNKLAGSAPTVETQAAIRAMEAKIGDLSVQLADRQEQGRLAEEKIRANPSSGIADKQSPEQP